MRMFVEATRRDYTSATLEQFTARLCRDAEQVRPVPLYDYAAAQLDCLGLLPNRCRYTRGAFRAICTRLCPQLYKLLDYLGAANVCDRGAQITMLRLFNDLVEQRFAALNGCQLLVDESDSSVQGLLTPGYVYYPLQEFASRVPELLGDDYVFCSAAWAGRHLSLVYARQTASAKMPTPAGPMLPLKQCVYASNPDMLSYGAVAGAGWVAPAGCMLSVLRRFRHWGAKFHTQLATELRRMAPPTQFPTKQVSACLLKSADHARKLVASGERADARRAVLHHCRKVLTGGGQTPYGGVVTRLLDMLDAATETDRLAGQLTDNPDGDLIYHLFDLLLTTSSEYHPHIAEWMAHAAYKLITTQRGA